MPLKIMQNSTYRQSWKWMEGKLSNQTQTQAAQFQSVNPSICTPPGLNLSVEQGETLSTPIALQVTDSNGVTHPVDITGARFQFTAKTDINLPDTDPSVVKIDWIEVGTPTQGKTSLVVPSNITVAMQALPYFYQVRMVQSPTSSSPIVTTIMSGTITVIQPVSTRYT